MKLCSRCNACLDDTAGCCPSDGNSHEQPFKGTNLIDGKYRLERSLGRGGMGAVYLARHEGLGKYFALKLIEPHSLNLKRITTRFNLEARALGKLKHPNIVDVTDYGVDPRDDGLPYLVMEHLVGETLQERLRNSSPLPFAETLQILEQVAEGIDWAHKHGVLHCDLKPGNVFLCGSDDKKGNTVKILDFGLARMFRSRVYRMEVDASKTETANSSSAAVGTSVADGSQLSETLTKSGLPSGVHEVGGTPAYMAPEVISGKDPCPPSDLYSFGIMAYELIVGRLPFSGAPWDMMRAHVADLPPKPSEFRREIAGEIEAAILLPLEKDPTQRPGYARDIVRAIRNASARFERRRWRAREIPRRAIMAVILAQLTAASWLPLSRADLVSSLERRTVDARFSISPNRLPDPRILVVTIDEDSLQADKTPIADKADEVAAMLQRVFAAKAAAVAIDFLLPYSWSRSQAFSRFVLEHASRLTLAAFVSTSSETLGTECISGLTAVALGPNQTRSLFGFVNLQEDGDGIVRRARLSYPDISGTNRDSWAAKAASSLANLAQPIKYSPTAKVDFWIDYTIDWRQFERVSWKDLKQLLDGDPTLFENRLLLVGGDYLPGGDDYHRVPGPKGLPGAVSGIVLQALIVNTVLSELPIREAHTISGHAIIAFICTLVLLGASCIQRIRVAAGLSIGVLLMHVVVAFLTFRSLKLIVPLYGPVAIGLLALGAGLLLRLKLAPFPSDGGEER